MKIHIVGSGAIGGMAGVHMAMHGEDVTFVDQWREHVEAMQQHGVRITGIHGVQQVPVRAILPDQIDEPLDLVFIAVKSQHTEAAIRAIMPHLTPASTVVSLQNGMNEEKIAALIGAERVIGALPDYTAALVDPGHLEFTVEGPIYVGELDGSSTPRVLEVQRLLAFLTETKLTSNIIGRVWTKQCYMCQIVMTAMVDASVNEVLLSDRNRLMGVALVREAITVADAVGIRLESDAYFQPDLIRMRSPEARRKQVRVLEDLRDHFAGRDAARQMQAPDELVKKGSGMWWDIVYRHRPSETRWLTGALIERGEQIGVPMPLNTATVNIIYEIEAGKRALGWENIEELAAMIAADGEPLSVEETVTPRTQSGT